MLRFHVEYVDPALAGEDVEIEIADPSSVVLDESGATGRLIAAWAPQLRGPVRLARIIRPGRDDYYLPQGLRSSSIAHPRRAA